MVTLNQSSDSSASDISSSISECSPGFQSESSDSDSDSDSDSESDIAIKKDEPDVTDETSEPDEKDTDEDGVFDIIDDCPDTFGEGQDGCPIEENVESQDEQDSDDLVIGILLMACILLVCGNLAWIIFADNRGEG